MRKLVSTLLFLLIFLFFFFFLNILATYAQNNTIDSLKKVLQTAKDDTNKVKTLVELATVTPFTDNSHNRLRTADEAQNLAKKLKYKKGEADAHDIKGKV